MPKFIILEAVTKHYDEDNSTINSVYIENFVTIVSNYSKEKRKWRWNKTTKTEISLKKN